MNSIITQHLDKIEANLSKCFDKTPQSPQTLPKSLIEPIQNILSRGGKRWRPLLLVLAAKLVSQLPDEVYELAFVPELIHNASLIHDDIEDKSDLRRGQPCVHLLYGQDTAINSASWLYFFALEQLKNLNLADNFKLRMYQFSLDTILRLHTGQAYDISWHNDKSYIPSLAEYETMIRMKTGALSELCVKLGVFYAGGDEQLAEKAGKVFLDLGVAFQIIDDIKNITTGNLGKKRGDDIVEGKKSLPMVLHVQGDPKSKDLIIKKLAEAENEGIDSKAVDECIEILHSSNCIEQSLLRARTIIKTIDDNLRAIFSPTQDLTNLLDFIHELVG